MILKGAMLFQIWSDTPHRATRDLDLLAEGDVTLSSIERKTREICEIEVEEDGLIFDLSKLVVEEIRENDRYGGVRARFLARLGQAKIAVQIDFGIGDIITPFPIETEYPSLLDMPKTSLFSYPRETVIAEKLEAIVDLGMANSRMKDYFDLWFLITDNQEEPACVVEAIRRTFERREQPLPNDIPDGLSDSFATDDDKKRQWLSFQQRVADTSVELHVVVKTIRDYAKDLFDAAHRA